jgi:hypothetical protein
MGMLCAHSRLPNNISNCNLPVIMNTNHSSRSFSFSHTLCILALTCVPMAAWAHGKHVHGEAQLQATIHQSQITLQLALPLEVAVGFERQPRTDAEKSALTQAEKALQNATALWQPTPAANCQVNKVEVTMPPLDGPHADITAHYRFECAQPQALKGIETNLFQSFKRLYRIESQRMGPNGQGAARLNPKKPLLSW